MKTYIYFIRHGDTTNPDQIWYGNLPGFGLSKKGVLQIEKTAKYFLRLHIDFIYCSPLLRARQSAEILKDKLGLKKIYLSQKITEVIASYDVFSATGRHIIGETIEELSERMQDFISQIAKLHKGKRIIVVSHGDPVMVVKAHSAGLPIKNSSIRPGRKDYIKEGEIYLLKI